MRNPDRKGIVWIVLLWLAAVGIFLFGVLAYAQARANPGRSDSRQAARVTIRGNVAEVLRHACSPALRTSLKVHTRSPYCATTDVVLATKNGVVNVRLGPTKFIRENHFFFVDGDRLLVIGFPAANHGRATVVSEEIIKSKRALTLRDPHGRPLWSRNEMTDNVPGSTFGQKHNQSVRENRTAQLTLPTGKAVATDLRFQKSEKEK